MFRDVSLAPDDIEWVRRGDDVKAALFDDRLFTGLIEDRGLRGAVEAFHEFHRRVANQLIRAAADDPRVSEWACRTIRLCKRAKWRRNVVRRMYRDAVGVRAELELRAELAGRFPRAEWGEWADES